ncbi:BCL2 associated agonist of cell death b [Trichomycterus rosablanca]|uniref:BCL2 associated agonist of cell death b n=1 Tax=Trichomycterus rosablanca TaxID=2290929 RepID=UPI002F35184F
MAKICTISDSESDASEDQESTEVAEANHGAKVSYARHHLPGSEKHRGPQSARQRKYSMNEVVFHETAPGRDEVESEEGSPFRHRSRSAPPSLWAAKKYGRQLRKMSDEFDVILGKGMKRVQSAGTPQQMHTSPSWLQFFWSVRESDAENTNSLTSQDSRPSE